MKFILKVLKQQKYMISSILFDFKKPTNFNFFTMKL